MLKALEPNCDTAYPSKFQAHRFCVAPMLDWTDRHCRYFYRLLSKQAFLYTEMVTTGALLHGDKHRFLNFDASEHPVAFQLGGSVPGELAVCAKMVEDYGYDEVNLNVGCPSDRVQNGRFGACLMATPGLVAECVAAMKQAVSIPVTVKSRIGIDEQDSYEELAYFVETVAAAGCRTFIVHARKAWLKGLSPKQNREVYHNPYLLTEVDARFYAKRHHYQSREQVIESLLPYAKEQRAQDVRLHSITRHILGLFHGVAGARAWRSYLSDNVHHADADEAVIIKALDLTRR